MKAMVFPRIEDRNRRALNTLLSPVLLSPPLSVRPSLLVLLLLLLVLGLEALLSLPPRPRGGRCCRCCSTAMDHQGSER